MQWTPHAFRQSNNDLDDGIDGLNCLRHNMSRHRDGERQWRHLHQRLQHNVHCSHQLHIDDGGHSYHRDQHDAHYVLHYLHDGSHDHYLPRHLYDLYFG